MKKLNKTNLQNEFKKILKGDWELNQIDPIIDYMHVFAEFSDIDLNEYNTIIKASRRVELYITFDMVLIDLELINENGEIKTLIMELD